VLKIRNLWLLIYYWGGMYFMSTHGHGSGEDGDKIVSS